MVALMANVDVAEKLNEMGLKLGHHDLLHSQNSETLKGVQEILLQQTIMNEKQSNHSEKMEEMNKRVDKMEQRLEQLTTIVSRNRDKIIYWSGGIAAVITLAALIKMVLSHSP